MTNEPIWLEIVVKFPINQKDRIPGFLVGVENLSKLHFDKNLITSYQFHSHEDEQEICDAFNTIYDGEK